MDGALKKKWKISLVVVLSLAVIGRVWLGRGPQEPEHQGKTLSEWVESGTSHFDKGAAMHFGTNALPVLRTKMLTKDSRFRALLNPLISQIPWLERQLPAPWKIRQNAQDYINDSASAGIDVSYTIPILIDLCRDQALDYGVFIFCCQMFAAYPRESKEAVPILYRQNSEVARTIVARNTIKLICEANEMK